LFLSSEEIQPDQLVIVIDDCRQTGRAAVRAAGVERRFAGRMETGRDSVRDPAMGMMLADRVS
jgi:hypothetical protein